MEFDISEIINHLRESETTYNSISSFSQLPGIYSIFFIGDSFPELGNAVKKHQIIYIGKTESSQEKRDAKTHFTNGKTGSSTLRKSIGSLLFTKEKLVPIPRNDTDYSKGRFSHFKFNERSEKIITKWMKNNLALSFYEFTGTNFDLENLESKIILELKPVLNLMKNPGNPYLSSIKMLRKNCADIAAKNSGHVKSSTAKETKPKKTVKTFNSTVPSGKSIIVNNITQSDVDTKKIRITVENKFLFPAEKIGVPSTYALVVIFNGNQYEVTYKIGSKDGKSRSGVLSLGRELYEDRLKIKKGMQLKISKLEQNKYSLSIH